MQYLRSGDWNIVAKLPIAATDAARFIGTCPNFTRPPNGPTAGWHVYCGEEWQSARLGQAVG
jgi:hypothetical protein